MRQVEVALAHARIGRHVFPCEGKQPRVKWQTAATTDEAMIRQWWKAWPSSTVGWRIEDGLTIVDVDDPSAAASLDLPDAPRQTTPSGGHHLLYIGTAPQTVKKHPGIDTRVGGKGYVILYDDHAFMQSEPHALPAWLATPATSDDEEWVPTGDDSVVSEAFKTGELFIPAGGRDNALTSIAGTLARQGATPEAIRTTLGLLVVAGAVEQPPGDELTVRDLRRIARSIGGKQSGKNKVDPTRWIATDLGPLIREGIPPADWVIEPILYRGHATTLYGLSGAGKTLIAGVFATWLVNEGRHVVYLDEENGQAIMARRLAAMRAHPNRVTEYFHYLDFRSPTMSDSDALFEAVRGYEPELVIFDSGADFYVAAGLDENDNTAMTDWAKAFPQRLARKLNVASLLIESVNTKGEVNRARGASAKKYKADVTWHFEAIDPPAVEHIGSVGLHRTKDRLGHLPPDLYFRLGGRDKTIICERLDGRPMSPEAEEEFARLVAQWRMLPGPDEPGLTIKEVAVLWGLDVGLTKTSSTDRVLKKLRDMKHDGAASVVGVTTGKPYRYNRSPINDVTFRTTFTKSYGRSITSDTPLDEPSDESYEEDDE